LIVTVNPEPVALAIDSAPVNPFREVRPLPAPAKPQLLAGSEIQMVPLPFGTVIELLAVGLLKPRVDVKVPLEEVILALVFP